MPQQNAHISYHATEVNELLSRPPGWLVRWGTTVILLAIFSLLFIAWFVRYPDVVTGMASISSVNPPQVLQAQQSGRLAKLLVPDGQNVHKGEVIAVLEDAANLNNVQAVDSLVQELLSIINKTDSSLFTVKWPQVAIGDLQSDYISLQNSYTDYANFLHQKVYPKKIAAMQNQLTMYYQYYQRSWEQQLVLQQQFDMAQARYTADSALAIEGVYSKHELSKRKEVLLQSAYSLHGARAALAQTQIQRSELEKNIADLQLEFDRERTNKFQRAQQAIKTIQNGIKNWLKRTAFVAHISGVVNYQTLWSVNQNVLQNQHLFTIMPRTKSEVKAIILVPPTRASKIKMGQRVQIKLDAYPFEEYGMLIGQVAKMNSSPTTLADGSLAYVVEINFANGLETSYHKKITELSELSGSAEIITEELSLLERIFYSLRKLFM